MAVEFKLPDIGEGLTEGEVTKWLVKEGESVAADQPMVEVLTDKATVEIPAPRAGVIQKILVPDGTKVPVGTVIVVIDDKAGGGAPASAPAKATPAQAATSQGGGGHAPAPAKAPAAPPPAPTRAQPAPAPARQPVAASAPQGAQARQAAPAVEGNGRGAPQAVAIDESRVVLAAPATRRLAREQGVDLRAVPGTGPHGRITATDLETCSSSGSAGGGARVAAGGGAPAAAPAPVAVSAPVVSAEDEHVPLKGVRGKIAEQMLRSKQHSPHFTFADECDVTELVALREQAKEIAKQRGVHLTYLPFVIKALVAAFRQFPTVNSVVDDTKNEFVIRKEYNVGIATDTEDGLMVPVVRNVDRRTILDIAAEMQRLTEAAREKEISLHERTV